MKIDTIDPAYYIVDRSRNPSSRTSLFDKWLSPRAVSLARYPGEMCCDDNVQWTLADLSLLIGYAGNRLLPSGRQTAQSALNRGTL